MTKQELANLINNARAYEVIRLYTGRDYETWSIRLHIPREPSPERELKFEPAEER